MIHDSKHFEDGLNKISRRYLLRNSAIAATGAALFPSFITGCSKDTDAPQAGGGSLGDSPPPTPEQLKAAADNLNLLRDMMNDLYNTAFKYDEVVFLALGSTKTNSSWTNFIVDIFIDIAFAAAAATAVVTGGAALVPAFAFLSAVLHDWGIGKDRPDGLSGVFGFFADYQGGQIAMQNAIDEKLGYMTDETDNYANLRTTWGDPIVINGKTYSFKDVGDTFFPDKEHHSVEYRKFYDPMYDHHKRSVWNLAVMKCCTYYRDWSTYPHTATTPAGRLLDWARNTYYKENTGAYIRASMYSYDTGGRPPDIEWEVDRYYLGIGGNQFPDAAAQILFKDDTPGHIINSNGLFNRSYVFEQFSFTKPVFPYGHELGNDQIGNLNPNADDWEYTGGLFPTLIHL
jgi:hypothetical protein